MNGLLMNSLRCFNSHELASLVCPDPNPIEQIWDLVERKITRKNKENALVRIEKKHSFKRSSKIH